jgi:hypothetical protein
MCAKPSDFTGAIMKAFKILCITALLLLSIKPVWAHHSSSGINMEGSVTVTGTVKQFQWANPHCWIEMEVVNAAGVSEIWNIEMSPPNGLIRLGFTKSSLKPGDVVDVTARPFFDSRPGGIFMSVKLANGETLGR